MKPFQASSPSVEVNGETVLSVVAGMGLFETKAREILATNGIQDPQPGRWYPQQAWLHAFKEISERLGPSTLYQIGAKIPESAKFPPEINSVESALKSIDMAYRMNHRGGDIGRYAMELVEPGKARVVCDNPYPSDFDRGLIEAVAKRFKPSGSFVVVEAEPDRPSRKQGGETCTFRVSW